MSKEKDQYLIIYVTTKDVDEASKICQHLLERKLVACGNIIHPLKSMFWWDNKIDQADEALLILKTRNYLFGEIVQQVKAIHSYSVPEIVALPIVHGSEDYLQWVSESVRQA